MLLGLAGVTGVGKSYYKDLITERLEFEKIKIITTREKRQGEKNGNDKIFVTPDELEKMVKEGKIAYKFDLLGYTYAYTNDEVFSNKNMVFELHWTTIFDWKKVCPNLKTIYLMPRKLEIAKQKLIERNLKPEIQKQRLEEIDEHYNRYNNDSNLRNMFDYVLYNDYNEESSEEVINLVKKLINEE